MPPQSLQRVSQKWLHWLFTFDFFPSWNRYLQYLKTPLAVLLIAAVVTFVCGVIGAPQIFLLFAATTCVIGIGLIYPWLAIRFVECRIEFSKQRIVEGEAVSSMLTVHNRWPIPICGLAIERGFLSQSSDSPNDDGVSVALAHVPAWCHTKFAWEFKPQCRGLYPRGDVFVSTAFPFGLWSAGKKVEIDDQVVVWPFPIPLQHRYAAGRRHVLQVNSSTMLAGNDADVTAIRPYRSGDVMRDVHWSASARCDQLVVKERQRPSESRTHIVLHISQDFVAQRQRSTDASLDWAIRMVAGLCEACVHARAFVTLEFGTQQFDVRSNRERNAVMDALSAVTLSDFGNAAHRSAACRLGETRILVAIVEANDAAGASPFVVQVTWQIDDRLIQRQVDVRSPLIDSPEGFQAECRRIVASLDQNGSNSMKVRRREVCYAG